MIKGVVFNPQIWVEDASELSEDVEPPVPALKSIRGTAGGGPAAGRRQLGLPRDLCPQCDLCPQRDRRRRAGLNGPRCLRQWQPSCRRMALTLPAFRSR